MASQKTSAGGERNRESTCTMDTKEIEDKRVVVVAI
jgi:hypothetical protein